MADKKILPTLLKNSLTTLAVVFSTFVIIVLYLAITFRDFEKVTDHLHNFADLGQVAITHVLQIENSGTNESINKDIIIFEKEIKMSLKEAKGDFLKIFSEEEFFDFESRISSILTLNNLVQDPNKKNEQKIQELEDAYIFILQYKNSHTKEKNIQIKNRIILSFCILILIMVITLFQLLRKITTLISPLKELGAIADNLSITEEKINIDSDYKYAEYKQLARALKDMHQRMTYESRISSQESTTSFLSDYSENLSHSINNPLAIIATTVKVLMKKAIKKGDAEIVSEMKLILNEVDRVSQITSMMKSLIHTTSKLNACSFDATNIGANINLLFFNKFFDKNIKFKQIIEKDIKIYGIEAIVIHVVVTLIDNAVKYIDSDKPEISLIIKSIENGVSVSVRDNGTAPSETQIYEYLLGNDKVSNLGLFSSRRLAEENGYRLFYNESPCKEFVLELSKNLSKL